MNFINKKNPFMYGFTVSVVALLVVLLQPSAAPARVAVAFDTAGGTPVEMVTLAGGGKLESIPTTSKTGFTFEHWLKGNDIVTLQTVFNANTTLRAVFEEIEFTITYEVNGGDPLEDEVVAYGETIRLPVPTKENSIFQGWYEEPSLTTLVPESIEVMNDMVVYAKWSVVGQDIYSVSFFSQGFGLISTEYVVPNTTIVLPVPPTREGYVFAYWINGITFEPVQTNSITINQDVVFFAEWNSVGGLVTITFDSQGGTPIPSIQVPIGSQWADPETDPYLDEGYQFLSWITNCNFDGFEVGCTTLDETYTVNDDMTVFAKYDYMVPLANMRFESYQKDSRVIGYVLSSIEDFTSEEPISTLVLPSKYAGVPVVALGSDLFDSAEYLETVIIPEGIQYIEGYAFGSSSIKEVFLPDSLIEIESDAFSNSSLETIHLSEDSQLKYIRNRAFESTNLTAFHAPKNLMYIGSEVFRYTQLETFTTAYPTQLAYIGNDAFQYSQLTSVTLPEGLRTIRGYAFADIETLTTLHIPASVNHIDNYAFKNTPLESITFGEQSQLAWIGNNLFGEDEDLESIPFIANSEDDFITAGPILIAYQGDIQNMGQLEIPEGIQLISNSTFANYAVASSVSFPEDLRFIGEYAFANATIGSSLSIPDGVRVERYAFYSTQISGDLTIGEITKLDYAAFNTVTAEDVTLLPNPHADHEYVLESDLFMSANIVSMTIGEGYMKIPYGFLQYSSVERINLPDSLTTLESGSIGSASLSEVNFSGTSPLLNVSGDVLSNEVQISEWYLNQVPYIVLKNHLVRIHTQGLSNGASLLIPDGVTSMGNDLIRSNLVTFESIDFNDVSYVASSALALYFHNLSINQSASFSNLAYFPGYIAYNNQEVLGTGMIDFKTNIEFDVEYLIEKNYSISEQLNDFLTFDDQGFKILGNALLDYNVDFDQTPFEVTIPSQIEIIGLSAFANATLPEDFTLNEGLQLIDQYAFGYTTFSDITLHLPSTLKYIQSSAFYDSNIVNVEIPASVKHIHSSAFDIDSLRNLTFEDLTDLEIDEAAFGYYSSRVRELNPFFASILEDGWLIADGFLFGYLGYERHVEVPEGILAIGTGAFNRRDSFIHSITLPTTLKVIHGFAFASCEYLTEIDFSDVVSLDYIGEYAFNFTAIQYLVIDAPITTISRDAINDMPHLLTYDFNLVNPTYLYVNAGLDIID